MLECATLVANARELDFTIGSALPTTQLSFPDDEFGRLPCANPGVSASSSTASVSTLATTPCDECPEPSWTTPVPQRATRSATSASVAASTAALEETQPLRLRFTESSPALIHKRVPDNWRAQRFSSAVPSQFALLAPPQPEKPLTLGMSPSGGSPMIGSPCGGAKRVRRTQSMFPSSQQFVTAEMGVAASPTSPRPLLGNIPCFNIVEDPIPRIKSQVLSDLLDGKISHHYDRVVVIDCRFEYEYAGGHIAGAVNISCKSKLEQYMFGGGIEASERPLVIFHCEYSAYRGPLMATHLRQCDRRANVYPKLRYPDIALLDGGYSNFYATDRARCEPQNYVGMNDDSHKVACEREMERFRVGMRFRKAQLFSRPSAANLPRAKFELHSHPNHSCPMLPLAQAFDGERTPLASLNM